MTAASQDYYSHFLGRYAVARFLERVPLNAHQVAFSPSVAPIYRWAIFTMYWPAIAIYALVGREEAS